MKEPKHGRLPSFLAWSCAILLILAWLTVNVLGDQYWWTVAILFGPRWVWGVLLIGVLPLAIKRWRLGVPLLLACSAIFTLGVLDFRLGLGRFIAPHDGNFRVLEFNADGDVGGAEKFQKLTTFIRDTKPDLVVIAECSTKLYATFASAFPDYSSRDSFSLCMLSRDSILSWDIRSQTDFWKRYGSGAIVRTEIQTKLGRLRLGLVHLATPRRALSKYNDSTKIESMESSTSDNLVLRADESAAARSWVLIKDSLPTIVTGDFNIPVASKIYRDNWSDFQNALSSTGVGLVHTKMLRLWGIRIDHVLAGNGIKVVRAWVGPDLGSDHLPVIAELRVPKPQ